MGDYRLIYPALEILPYLYRWLLLGHSSIAITLDTYSHVSPGLQEAAAQRFDDAFNTRYNRHENEVIEKVG